MALLKEGFFRDQFLFVPFFSANPSLEGCKDSKISPASEPGNAEILSHGALLQGKKGNAKWPRNGVGWLRSSKKASKKNHFNHSMEHFYFSKIDMNVKL